MPTYSVNRTGTRRRAGPRRSGRRIAAHAGPLLQKDVRLVADLAAAAGLGGPGGGGPGGGGPGGSGGAGGFGGAVLAAADEAPALMNHHRGPETTL